MRYVFFAVVSVVSLIFTGTIFPNLNIAGIYPDIIMCSIVSIALIEKSMAGAMLGLFCGLMLDLFFSGIIGFYALPYFVAGAILYFVSKNLRYLDKIFLPLAFVLGAYFVKEIVSSLLAYMLGVQFSFANMFIKIMLPQGIATVVLMVIVHLIFLRVYRSSSMKLKSSEDFKHL